MKNSIKVLIVDDDKSSSALLGEVVKRLGFKPIIVSKATDGLNVAKLQTVHAAIVDVLLPKMSGVDLAMEFRKTRFGENPVIFVSGVFKDKVFKEEALRKSGAIDFLFKPFSADELQELLTRSLASQLSSNKQNVQSLLMRQLNSARERAKAIEQLDSVRGQEFSFVLSILMDAGLSGHLNIVNDAGEIFGVTLSHGTVAEVDSSESQATGVLALISGGYLSQEDWDAFQRKGSRKFPLDRLVQENYVSPHAVGVAKHAQILADFRAICSANSMQLNFVPQDGAEAPPKHAVTQKELLRLLASSMDEFFPSAFLGEFYSVVKNSPMNMVRSPEELQAVWGTKLFAPLTGLRRALEEGGDLDMALHAHPGLQTQIYQCLHYLVLSRYVIFDDVEQTRVMNSTVSRYQKLYTDLKDLSPDKVFAYFGGGGDRLSPSMIERIFDDYTKSNGPDQLAKDSPAELIDLARKCFQIVSAARDIMVDDRKRAALFESLKVESAQKVKKSNELTAQALDLLRKGQFEQAVDVTKQAEAIAPTSLQYLIMVWAQVKGNLLSNKADLLNVAKKIENMPPDERKSTYWNMVLGIVKKALGDASCIQYFEKVVQMEPSFVEAKRELAAIQPQGGGKKKNDLLSGDLSEIVSQLFRTKAK